MIDAHSCQLTHIQRVGPGLATRSNSSSDRGHPVISMKHKFGDSKDLLTVYPQKVTQPAPFSLVSDNVPSASVVRPFSVFIC